MKRLVEERPQDDPAALYEWAPGHDFLFSRAVSSYADELVDTEGDH